MSHPIQKDPSIQLKDGSEWADHEDCIIGNRAGIESLKSACEDALEKGEYYGSDLGDYVGVKVVESTWFEDPKDSKSTRIGNAVVAGVLIAILGFFIVGVFSVGSFLFGFFT